MARPSEHELIVQLGEQHRALSSLYEAWQVAASARNRPLAAKLEARYRAALERYLDDLSAVYRALSPRALDEVIADLCARLERGLSYERLDGAALDLFEALLGRLGAAYDLRLGRYDVARLHRGRLEQVARVFLRIGAPSEVSWATDDHERYSWALERARELVAAGTIPQGPVTLAKGVVVTDPARFLETELGLADAPGLAGVLARDRIARFMEALDGLESDRAGDRAALGRDAGAGDGAGAR